MDGTESASQADTNLFALLLARLYTQCRRTSGQTSRPNGSWRLPSSVTSPHMQLNSPGAARDGGPVVLHPVRATLFVQQLTRIQQTERCLGLDDSGASCLVKILLKIFKK